MRSFSRTRLIAIALAVLTAAAVMSVSACSLTAKVTGKIPDGTYVANGLVEQKFTFRGDEVIFTAFGLNASGTYKLEDGKINITYTVLGVDMHFERPYEISGDTLKIGGTEFIKQK